MQRDEVIADTTSAQHMLDVTPRTIPQWLNDVFA